jgi:hypothetical protein
MLRQIQFKRWATGCPETKAVTGHRTPKLEGLTNVQALR